MRNMSFMLTTDQIRNKSKTVTRRLGWKFLKKNDLVRACKKCMGLKKGEKIEQLGIIKVVSVTEEKLYEMTKNECIKEGFPEMEPHEFVDMFCGEMKCFPHSTVTRIEFFYCD